MCDGDNTRISFSNIMTILLYLILAHIGPIYTWCNCISDADYSIHRILTSTLYYIYTPTSTTLNVALTIITVYSTVNISNIVIVVPIFWDYFRFMYYH